MSAAIGYAGSFGVCAAITAIGGAALYRYLPETAGLRLESTELLFKDPYPDQLYTGVPNGAGSSSGKKTESSALLPGRDEPLLVGK